MKLINCEEARHAGAILEIFNDAIVHSTALYDYRPRDIGSMSPWFALKAQHHFPVIGVEDDRGQLLGFASYGTFRAWPAYKYSVEHSLYIQRDNRGRGLGKLLLSALIQQAQKREVHTLIGGIDATNQASIALHEKAGFQHTGTIRQAAYKFDLWLDLAFYQLILPTPTHPVGDDGAAGC